MNTQKNFHRIQDEVSRFPKAQLIAVVKNQPVKKYKQCSMPVHK
jgi:hypothetical protein